MPKVAWAPEGMLAPMSLTAVQVEQGTLMTRQTWLDALETRVSQMANQEQNPKLAVQQACEALGVTESTDNPNLAGQYLLGNNWNLKAWLDNAVMDKEPFGVKAQESEDAREALEMSDFQLWVDLALSAASESSLD